MRMAVALNHLRGDWRHLKAKTLANLLFNFRAEMCRIADGAGDFSVGHAAGGFAEAGDVALVFREPVGDFQAKCDGFGVNAVRSANLWGVLELMGAQVEDFREQNQVSFDDVRGVAD